MHRKDKLGTFNNDLLPFLGTKGRPRPGGEGRGKSSSRPIKKTQKEVSGQSYTQGEQAKTHLGLMAMNTIFGKKTKEVRTFYKDFTH